jgi:hypothetical protein
LLAQDEDPILHATHGRVGFNKDRSSPYTDQGKKSLPSAYFIIFSLPNIYMQIRPGSMVVGIYIAPWPSHPGSTITSMTQQLHHVAAKSPRQRHRQLDSVAPSPA